MVDVSVQSVAPRKLAAVRRRVTIGQVGDVWRPALDVVWSYLHAHPALYMKGHNVFIYHHPRSREAPMDVEFGVEVTRPFSPEGEVYATETPGGLAARAVHAGSYQHLRRTHEAIHAWANQDRQSFAGTSWEVYGDWFDDPAKLETTIYYLLR